MNNKNWEECPRDAKESRWASLYATLYPTGEIIISRFTFEALGEPQACLLLYDRESRTIGLKPARTSVEPNAYPLRSRGRHGGQIIRGYRLCREFGIHMFETVKFPRAEIDRDGILLLDLNHTRTAARMRAGG